MTTHSAWQLVCVLLARETTLWVRPRLVGLFSYLILSYQAFLMADEPTDPALSHRSADEAPAPVLGVPVEVGGAAP